MFAEWDAFVHGEYRQNTDDTALSVQDKMDILLSDMLRDGNDVHAMKYKPMHQTYDQMELIMKQLLQYKKIISEKLHAIEDNNANTASQYKYLLQAPNKILEHTSDQIQNLEERFSKMSSAAVVIGDQLATLDKERLRVLETDELMETLTALNDTKNPKYKKTIANILQDFTNIEESANFIKKLRDITADISSKSLQNAVAEIEKVSQVMENQLLEQFCQYQKQNEHEKLRRVVRSVMLFSDIEKFADRFVWNVFSHELKITNILPQSASESSLNPIHDLELLFEKIELICKSQFRIIEEIFPQNICTIVRETLVERLFSDPVYGILGHFDRFLEYPQSKDVHDRELAASKATEYVQLLRNSYEKTCQLADRVEQLDDIRSQSTQKRDNNASNVGKMRPFLLLQLHSLFGSHQKPYFAAELIVLQYNFQQLMDNLEFPPEIPTHKQFQMKSKQNSDMNGQKLAAMAVEKEVLEFSVKYFAILQCLLENTQLSKKYSLILEEAVTRCTIVLNNTELQNELITKLFTTYCNAFGENFVLKLATAMERMLQDPFITNTTESQYLQLFKHLLTQHDAVEETFSILICPKQQDAPTQLTICYENKRRFSEKIELLIENMIQECFQVTEKKLQNILSQQEKTDFFRVVNNTSLVCSKTCKRIVEHLEPIVLAIVQTFTSENCDNLLQFLAQLFKKLLIQHILRYKFDADGACTLLRDVDMYRKIFDGYPEAEIQKNFQQLQEIANIFALPSENIHNYIRDSRFLTIPKSQLIEIIKRRYDAKLIVDKLNL